MGVKRQSMFNTTKVKIYEDGDLLFTASGNKKKVRSKVKDWFRNK